MRVVPETLHAGQGWPRRRGLISGYVWKLIRESIDMTQFQLAEELRVDATTVQGWESGRRPLIALSWGDLARFRIRLICLGANPALFLVLNDAIEADLVIDDAVRLGDKIGSVQCHSLAATVHRRDLTNLITWPLTGVMPTQLRGLIRTGKARRGPVANHPILGAEERSRFFDHLLALADAHRASVQTLVRRQAIYLLAFDENSRTKQWLADEHVRTVRSARRLDDIPSWVAVRSSAVALARNGDPDPLLSFVAAGLTSEGQEIANLNYWAYWVGEIGDVQTDDSFMRQIGAPWDGVQLLEHLTRTLRYGSDHAELNVHTLWQLMLVRPHLLSRQPELRARTLATVCEALDASGLTVGARQQLSNVAYAIRCSDQ